MPSRNKKSSHNTRNSALSIIAALASGDATSQDVIKKLKSEGLETLDLLVEVLARGLKASSDHVRNQHLIRLQSFSEPTSPEVTKRIQHKIPRIPVQLNGTLYDPSDIRRFDGYELHFIPEGDQLLAIDDRAVIARWWENSYLASALNNNERGGKSGVKRQIAIPPSGPTETGGELPPSGQGGPAPSEISYTTYFYDDVDFKGSNLSLPGKRGYPNLVDVGRGFLGLGDWNDVISSLHMFGPTVCILHEHINWQGATLTLGGSAYSLVGFGWNDRASSVQTW